MTLNLARRKVDWSQSKRFTYTQRNIYRKIKQANKITNFSVCMKVIEDFLMNNICPDAVRYSEGKSRGEKNKLKYEKFGINKTNININK